MRLCFFSELQSIDIESKEIGFVLNEVLCQHPRKKKKDNRRQREDCERLAEICNVVVSIIGTAEHTCVCLMLARFCWWSRQREMRLVELHPSHRGKAGRRGFKVQIATWRSWFRGIHFWSSHIQWFSKK